MDNRDFWQLWKRPFRRQPSAETQQQFVIVVALLINCQKGLQAVR
jgi:hypothetical protein